MKVKESGSICKEIEGTINLQDFLIQNLIGRGSFGKIYKIKDKLNGLTYAAKISHKVELDNLTDSNILDSSAEINILSKLNHPSVLKFIGYSPINFKGEFRPVIVTEYAANGSLEDIINTGRSDDKWICWDSTRKLIITYGIASAMSYLHSHGIIHRDLKPENILIDEFFFPKIADFGLSKQSNSILNSITGSIKGTPIYMSPEIWKDGEYSKASDVYAFGLIVYEIYTGRRPFENLHFFQIISELSKGTRPTIDDDTSICIRKLIQDCWDENPERRPTFDEIVALLRNEKEFRENVDEQDFLSYVKYIDNQETSFNLTNLISEKKFKEEYFKKISAKIKINESICSIPNMPLSLRDLNQLTDDCRTLIIEAAGDQEKEFLIAQYFIDGQENFPQNLQLGIKYLKKLIELGNIQSAIYYSEMLIKGDITVKNNKKAEKILEKYIKERDNGSYYLLKGKISKKNEKFDEAACFFEK